MSKINKDDVKKIRELAEKGVPQVELLKKWDVSASTMSDIINNKIHKDRNYIPPELKQTKAELQEYISNLLIIMKNQYDQEVQTDLQGFLKSRGLK